ncbi:MAG TPA: CoA ester lyase [Woeseiaceae bacterium]|nr:CoA ester lyase [Woeseiaceae bacterium]
MRSYLFVPADSERKLAKADAAGADALILDLEDSVAPSRRETARRLAAEFLAGPRGRAERWVRINGLGSGAAGADLPPVVVEGLDGIVVPKAGGAEDVLRLDRWLGSLEAAAGMTPGSVRILPIATETPAAVFRLAEYAQAGPRLAGLSWGAEDLSAAIGAMSARDGHGRWLPTFQTVRSLCVLAAAAAGVPAVDTVYTDFRDLDGLRARAGAARRDGFLGMLAIHPAQVTVVNETFTPTDAEVADARRIVDAFAAAPDAGVLDLDGRMVDRPHLLQARRVLSLARAAAAR